MSTSKLRRRPILFGNPALGTYGGDVYTLEKETKSQQEISAESLEEFKQQQQNEGCNVDSMVALVEVPPDQVTEGILNLARSHRPWILHVRIVIDVLEDGGSLDNNEDNDKTYLILFHMSSPEAADDFCHELDGRPYTFLDETITCKPVPVVALNGHNGVSLLNPLFASKQTTMSAGALGVAGNVPDDFNCAVCLEHMNSKNQTSSPGIFTTVCNHTFHLDCILKCQDSPCPVCRYDHAGLNDALSQCHICGTTENNYVCLICGVVSCVTPLDDGQGSDLLNSSENSTSCQFHDSDKTSCKAIGSPRRVTSRPAAVAASPSSTLHPSRDDDFTARQFNRSCARKHYDETLHAYALDTQTQHVWDFAGQGYVHRLLQNKQDGKLVEVSDPYSMASLERTQSPGLSETQEGEVLHRKLEGYASQYYTLLKSQLEQQRIFYEGRLQELRQEHGIERKPGATKSENPYLAALRQEKRQLQQRLQSLQKKNSKVKEDVKFLKSMNESLEANKPQIEIKIQQAQKQRVESREMVQKYLPALEEKVTSLILQLEQQNTAHLVSQDKN
ncbi:unnamed protein product [Cylindrotheca closterium]|uniref:RING-type domain-containing protein n=1 Tax=Cylindrotheca closterium TaxID=2856 RepID=A0AAD2CTC7_9STRA|nr:unnamed protein product [Cylindrotheca closterium]